MVTYIIKNKDGTTKISNIVCPQCREWFILKWDDYDKIPATLIIRACPSGGIYDVSISCPHCDYEEEL